MVSIKRFERCLTSFLIVIVTLVTSRVGDGNAGRGALIGAAVGGATGAAVGNKKDKEQGYVR